MPDAPIDSLLPPVESDQPSEVPNQVAPSTANPSTPLEKPTPSAIDEASIDPEINPSEPIIGQGVKDIPPPPDPFSPSETKLESLGEKPTELEPPIPTEKTKPMAPSVTLSTQKFSSPTPPLSASPQSSFTKATPPEVTRAIEVAKEINRSRRHQQILITTLVVILLLLAAGGGTYLVIKSYFTAPPQTNNPFNVSSIVSQNSLTPPPTFSPATPSAGNRAKNENGFGQLPPTDFSSWLINGLNLKALVIDNEATFSAEFSPSGGQAYVYELSDRVKAASPSAALVSLSVPLNLIGIKNSGPNDFQNIVRDASKSYYKLKTAEAVINEILSAAKIYGLPQPPTDLSKNPLQSLTLNAVELDYFQTPQYLIPIYVVRAKGTLKANRTIINLFFWGEAFTRS